MDGSPGETYKSPDVAEDKRITYICDMIMTVSHHAKHNMVRMYVI